MTIMINDNDNNNGNETENESDNDNDNDSDNDIDSDIGNEYDKDILKTTSTTTVISTRYDNQKRLYRQRKKISTIPTTIRKPVSTLTSKGCCSTSQRPSGSSPAYALRWQEPTAATAPPHPACSSTTQG